MDRRKHIIFTDGSSGGGRARENGGIGSWAFIEVSSDTEDGEMIINKSGYVYDTTNNRMELTAIIQAIRSCDKGDTVVIISDSGYCVMGYNDSSYLHKWVYNGWRTSSKKPVENRDLWEQILQLDKEYDIKMLLIKGHGKDKGHRTKWNNACDKICTERRLLAVKRYEVSECEIPMECPSNCRFMNELFDQDGMCYRCPVRLCKDTDPVIPFDEYNNAWMAEWNKFFKGEINTPILRR